MRRMLATVSVLALILGGAVFAQEGDKPEGGRRGDGQGPGQGMRGGGQMMGVFELFKTFRGLRSVMQELDVDQKAKFDAAMAKMMEKMKGAQAEFETELAGILTPEQMQKFNEDKEAPPGRGMGPGGQGGQGGRGGQGGPGGEGQGGPRGNRDPKQMIKQMDANGDGKVTKDEYTGPEQFFTRLDTDGDGVLSAAEIEAAGQMRGRGKREGGAQE